MAFRKLQFNKQFRWMNPCGSARLRIALSTLSVFWLAGCGRVPAVTDNGGVIATSPTPWRIEHVASVTVADKTGCVSITASLDEQSIAVGQDVMVHVEITVIPGYHVNGDVPASGPYSALNVQGSADDASIVVLPSTLPVANEIADGSSVHRNSVTALIPLRVDPIRNSQFTLSIQVTVQACNDLACFPPETIEIKLPLLIVQNARLSKGD